VEASRDELHRLALNLIENALRHTPPGTEIRISTGLAAAGTTRPPAGGAHRAAEEALLPAGEAYLPASEAYLIVEDDGPGVPERLSSTLFERFVRGAGDRGSSFGLGLAIVRAVAESHGGAVTLQASHPGAERPGARFVVSLPALPGTSPPPAAGSRRSSAAPGVRA
jgi:signal transduction histidine kinase